MAKYQEWITPAGLEKIAEWTRAGLTDKQIARNVGINKSTYYNWLTKYEEIKETVDKARRQTVEELENSLYKKALGFTESDKYYPPDTGAIIFLLKNWKRNSYRDKPLNDLEQENLRLNNEYKKLINESLDLKNEMLRQVMDSGNESDKLDQLLQVLEQAETID